MSLTDLAFAARLEAAFAGAEPAHGTCLLLGAAGVLIRGPSGAGKSRLAARMIEDGAHLVADDRVALAATAGALLARPPARIAGLMEIRGLGLVREPFERLARIRLIVDLAAPDRVHRLPHGEDRTAEILGLVLPRLRIVSGDPLAPRLIRRAAAGRDRFDADGVALSDAP